MKKRKQNNAKYERFGVQRETSKKFDKGYIKLYMIEEVVLKKTVRLKLLVFIRIHPVVNVSRVV